MTESALTRRSARMRFRAGPLTGGPWSPEHQHAGPPSALICRAVERAAAPHGLTHIGRLTVNLLRPLPIGDCRHRNPRRPSRPWRRAFLGAADGGRRRTSRCSPRSRSASRTCPCRRRRRAIRRRGAAQPPEDCRRRQHGLCAAPSATRGWSRTDWPRAYLPRARARSGFASTIRSIAGETPSPYQRVAVAADSGNGVSAALDFAKYVFVNCDLTINLFRRPLGRWICLDARAGSAAIPAGSRNPRSTTRHGLIGRATQSLAVRAR